MTAQCLRVLAGVHREHLPKQGGCRPVGQQSGELRPQPIQLRSRAGVRRPLHACPGRAAASTAKAGQPDRNLAEQRGDRVQAIVLHAANARATPAPRPPDGVVPGLRGDDLPLDTRQHQLRFGQGQTQIGDVDEAIGPADLHDVRARPLAFGPDFHQPQNPSHTSTLAQRTSAEIPDRRRTPNLATVPWRYLYRAIDKHGTPIDFLLTAKRDLDAAKRFFRKMLKDGPLLAPDRIGTDGAGPYPPAIATRRSLCSPSSSLWKHCKLLCRRDATRAPCPPNRGGHPFVLQMGGSDLVRSAWHDLLSAQDACCDQPADAVARDPKRCSGFGHREPFAVLLGGTVGMKAVYPAHRADTVRRPGLALTGWHSHPVERGGDIRVRPAGCHAPYHRERRLGRAAPVLAGFRLSDARL